MAPFQSLRDAAAFPDFSDLPQDDREPGDEINFQYYHSQDERIWSYSRHWCLLVEIMTKETAHGLRLFVKDKSGQIFPMGFFPAAGEAMPHPDQFQVGQTLALLYAHGNFFIDKFVGVRQTYMRFFQVIPASLKQVLETNDKASVHHDMRSGRNQCQLCGDDGMLSKCAQCGMVWYCGKECQLMDWETNGHKDDCKIMQATKGFYFRDWSTFKGFWKAPLAA